MIIGYGIDNVTISRIEKTIKQFGDRFRNRVYTDYEVEFIKSRGDRAEMYASFWAVKEATMKAMGTGYKQGIWFKNIEVKHKPTGKPYLELYGNSKERAEHMGVDNMQISITHEVDSAFASVIFESYKK